MNGPVERVSCVLLDGSDRRMTYRALSSAFSLIAQYSKWPSGSNWGWKCLISWSEASTFVRRAGVPPESATCINPLVLPNRIRPSSVQTGASPNAPTPRQRATGSPPERSARQSWPNVIQPTDLESGDQKGSAAEARSVNKRSADPSSGCNHKPTRPFTDAP